MLLPEDIVTKVRRDYSEDDSLRVLLELRELKQADPELFHDRILRCLIVYANGRIEEFAKAVTLARLDSRDLIVAAEHSSGDRVRLLSQPFGICPDVEIIKQWLAGRQITVPWGIGCDEKWTIEYPEIREFSLKKVDQLKNASPKVLDPNLYFAYFSFLCIRGSQEISAANALEAGALVYYRLHPETGGFEFQKFLYRPQDLVKRGKW